MRRGIFIGILIGALLFSGALAAKIVNVTNPMTTDLNAGGYNITNAGGIEAASVDSGGIGATEIDVKDSTVPTYIAGIRAGTADPSTPCQIMNAGSLYLRGNGGYSGLGELWQQQGPGYCNWHRISP